VADHSIRCAENVPEEFKLEALLHDATEAYLVDMPRPIKYALQGYRDIEENIDKVVRKKFNLPSDMSLEVKNIDAVMLSTERRDLMQPSELEWHKMPDPLSGIVYPRTPRESYNDFLQMYHDLIS
jgi:5'-deoxynucleotidase YfbR-like HD superfamily hydrolase